MAVSIPSPEYIDFEEAEIFDIILVPRDDRSILHARRLDGSHVVKRFAR